MNPIIALAGFLAGSAFAQGAASPPTSLDAQINQVEERLRQVDRIPIEFAGTLVLLAHGISLVPGQPPHTQEELTGLVTDAGDTIGRHLAISRATLEFHRSGRALPKGSPAYRQALAGLKDAEVRYLETRHAEAAFHLAWLSGSPKRSSASDLRRLIELRRDALRSEREFLIAERQARNTD